MANTQTQVESETKTQAKPEVHVDPKLASLYAVNEKAKNAASKAFVAIVEYVKENREHCTDAVIRKTLIEARGFSPESANTELNRIKNMLMPQNQESFEKFRRGEITVAAMRSVKGGPTNKGRPATPLIDKIDNHLKALALQVICELNPKGEVVLSREDFLAKAGFFYDEAVQYKKELDAAKAQEQQKGTPEAVQAA
jgi:hypothetical protein